MNIPGTQAGWGGTPIKAQTKRRTRVRLDSVTDARKEAARIYRAAINGDVKIEDASRLANILALIGRMIEGSDLEARLAALEGK